MGSTQSTWGRSKSLRRSRAAKGVRSQRRANVTSTLLLGKLAASRLLVNALETLITLVLSIVRCASLLWLMFCIAFEFAANGWSVFCSSDAPIGVVHFH